MKKFLTWLDHNLLTILTAVLIVIIPLYPKIPLAELIQGYIVRLRLDDILVLITLLVYLVQLRRGKARLPAGRISWAILVYLAIGLLSVLSAMFITHTVPLQQDHLFKLWFHWLRRIEYFSLFFITYAALRTKKDLLLFIKIGLATLAGVVLYGIGQKYFYFPAFSTMNREFSKGVRLYLEPNTRLFSTFGGHYDLAGYLMMLLALTVPAAWLTGQRIQAFFSLISLLAYWALVLTTSRTSFLGYVVGITAVAILIATKYGLLWTLKRWLVTMFVSLVVMFSFSNLLERFTQVIPNPQTRAQILQVQKIINEPFVREPDGSQAVTELPSLFAFLFHNAKPQEITLTPSERSQLSQVASLSDRPPIPNKPTQEPALPSDVTQASEDIRKTAVTEQGKVYDGPSYSPNALKYGLSMGIRLDVLWPNAIAGLRRNPLLGSGYSTLVKSNVGEFTYAESTDNDYLRMLGETGLLGTLAYLAVLALALQASRRLYDRSPGLLDQLLSVGYIGATLALLVNATYIDIFESSKVIYTYWMLTALVIWRSNYSFHESTNHAQKI